jgi:hypothetical protein
VEGQFLIHNNYVLTSVVVPELISVGSFNFVRNWALTSLNMPKLVRSNGVFALSPYDYVTSNLTAINLPLLTRVDGELVFSYLLKLATVNVAQLDHIAGRFQLDNSLVSVLSFTSLTFVGGEFNVQSNLMMTTLSIPALATVSVRTATQCAFSMSGGCPALATCPSS